MEAFGSLKALMAPRAAALGLTEDGPEGDPLDPVHILQNDKPLFFGAV